MKYTCRIDINKPLQQVVDLFENPNNMKNWQPGLLSMEHLKGQPGEPGAQSKLFYKFGKREVTMVETIISNDLPRESERTYETSGVKNIVHNFFEPIDEHSTRYRSEQEFQFSGFMKLMGWFMPGAFRKETEKYLERFKEFAEAN